MQRIHIPSALVQKQHGIVPVVPVVQGDKQSHSGKSGLGQRHRNIHVNPQIPCAVQFRRLIQSVRNAHHVAFQYQQISYIDQNGKDQCYHAVVKMKVFCVKNVPWHQAAPKNRGKVKEEGHLVTVPEIPVCKHISSHTCEPQPCQRSRHRHENGNGISPQQFFRNPEQHLICVKGKRFGNQPVTMQGNGVLFRHGAA